MSDNIQEQDMEGILSSIKDILEEDEKKQQVAENVVNESTEDVLGDVLNSTNVTDILELSPDMMVDTYVEEQLNDANVDETPKVYEAPMNEENNIVDSVIAETEVNTQIENNSDVVENIVVDEPFFSEQVENTVEDNLLNEPFFENTANTEFVSSDEPFFETDNNSVVDELIADNEAVAEFPTIDEMVSENPVIEEDSAAEEIPVVEEINEPAPVVETTPIVEEVFEPIPDVFEPNTVGNDDVSLDDLLGSDNDLPLDEVIQELPITEDVIEPAPVVEEVIEPAPVVEEVIELAPVVEEVIETTPVVEEVIEPAPVVEEVIETTPVVEEVIETTPVVEEVIEPAPVVEDVIEPAPVVEEVIETTPVVEEVIEPAPVVEEIIEPAPVVEETAVFEPVIEVEPISNEEQSQDVSSNIMSNFAKMFSHEEKSEEPEITSVGNSSKTLEEFVVDAIKGAIGKEISAKWNNGVDFNSFAEAEIRRQVELWITNNMNGLIEDIVKKEVERVIAKVGS